MVKEAVAWFGWLDVHSTGPLQGRLHVAASQGNSGRLAEFAASLGEAVALAFLVDVLRVPLASVVRIPETGPEGMDFKDGVTGQIAVEGKGGHGSCVAPRKKDAMKQMKRQSAAEKYGVIVCYQQQGKSELKSKGSYVHVFDPPGDRRRRRQPPLEAVLRHYRGIAEAIGWWALVDGLGAALALPERDGGVRDWRRLLSGLLKMDGHLEDEELWRARRTRISMLGPGIAFRLGSSACLARAFFAGLNGIPSALDRPYPGFGSYFLLGLRFDVAVALAKYVLDPNAEHANSLVGLVLGDDRRERLAFSISRDGALGPVRYTGLEDGVVRVDLVAVRQVVGEDFDVNPINPG